MTAQQLGAGEEHVVADVEARHVGIELRQSLIGRAPVEALVEPHRQGQGIVAGDLVGIARDNLPRQRARAVAVVQALGQQLRRTRQRA